MFWVILEQPTSKQKKLFAGQGFFSWFHLYIVYVPLKTALNKIHSVLMWYILYIWACSHHLQSASFECISLQKEKREFIVISWVFLPYFVAILLSFYLYLYLNITPYCEHLTCCMALFLPLLVLLESQNADLVLTARERLYQADLIVL